LNAATYLKIISGMKDVNLKIAKELTENKAGGEAER